MRQVRRRCITLAALAALGCGARGEGGPTAPDRLWLALELTAPDTMTLTSNFQCIDCPVSENGRPFRRLTTTPGAPTPFRVSHGACYRAGGLFFLVGYVWSETICVP